MTDGGACALSGGKAELLRHYEAAEVKPFLYDHKTTLHNATDYDRWAKAKAPYEVAFSAGYEPWGIVLRCSFDPYLTCSADGCQPTAELCREQEGGHVCRVLILMRNLSCNRLPCASDAVSFTFVLAKLCCRDLMPMYDPRFRGYGKVRPST